MRVDFIPLSLEALASTELLFSRDCIDAYPASSAALRETVWYSPDVSGFVQNQFIYFRAHKRSPEEFRTLIRSPISNMSPRFLGLLKIP